MNIILIGYMACGKTSTGRQLAQKLGCDFIDLDHLIVEKAGMTIPEIFENIGEKAFRDLESYVVSLTPSMKSCIIATGGGAVLRDKNRRKLHSAGMVIWLETTAENVQRYASRGSNRPLLKGDKGSVENITAMMQEREPYYRDCCHYSIDVTQHNLHSLVNEIEMLYSKERSLQTAK